MNHRLRFLVLVGVILIVAPSIFTLASGKAAWAADPIYQGSIWAVAVLLLWWTICEILMRIRSSNGIRITLNAMTFAAFLPVCVYLSGTSLSAGVRNIQTWHLLPLFAVMYQISSIIIAAVVACMVVGITLASRRDKSAA